MRLWQLSLNIDPRHSLRDGQDGARLEPMTVAVGDDGTARVFGAARIAGLALPRAPGQQADLQIEFSADRKGDKLAVSVARLHCALSSGVKTGNGTQKQAFLSPLMQVQHSADDAWFPLQTGKDEGAGVERVVQIAFSDPPRKAGAPGDFARLSEEAGTAHELVLEAALRPFELASDLDVDLLQASGFNTLGNVHPPLLPHERGDALVTEDGSVVYRPARIAIATAPEVDAQAHSGDWMLGQALATKEGGRIEIPLDYLRHGEHEIRIELTRPLSEKETARETLRVSVQSDSPELASLPVRGGS